MFNTLINSKEEALCHLFLHCCYKDEDFREKEMDYVSGLFVELDLHAVLNFKNEIIKYRNFKSVDTNETEYLKFLVKQIHPVHTYALYSYCVEMLLSDALLELREEKLLEQLGQALEIPEEPQKSIIALITQRKAVELEKIF